MKKIKITIKAITTYKELSKQYEQPIKDACPYKVGDYFIVDSLDKPNNLCSSAWQVLYPYIMTLLCGGENIHGQWMKDKHSAMVSCNDGFRPVSFYLEVIDDEQN